MNDFSIVDGVAQIHNPELYRTWIDRPDYMEAVAASSSPEVTATKRLLIEFEAELARMVRDGSVQEKVQEVMTGSSPKTTSSMTRTRPATVETCSSSTSAAFRLVA